jgi:hypothetical protein
MMFRWRSISAAAVIFAVALRAAAAGPLDLQLSALSEAWIPGGATVRVPGTKCVELQVRLNKPWANEIRIDALELKLDGAYPRFTRLTAPEGHLLNVKTREPQGLLPREMHRIEAGSEGASAQRAEWNVIRWDKPYIEAVVASPKGIPLAIQWLDQPTDGIVLVSPKGQARFHGRLAGPIDARLTINDRDVARLASKPGYEFDQEITIPAGAKEVIVRAEDEAHDITIHVLPVLR